MGINIADLQNPLQENQARCIAVGGATVGDGWIESRQIVNTADHDVEDDDATLRPVDRKLAYGVVQLGETLGKLHVAPALTKALQDDVDFAGYVLQPNYRALAWRTIFHGSRPPA